MDTLGIEPRASRMLSRCDTTTPCALEAKASSSHSQGEVPPPPRQQGCLGASVREMTETPHKGRGLLGPSHSEATLPTSRPTSPLPPPAPLPHPWLHTLANRARGRCLRKGSSHPESSQGPSDGCFCLQSDALPTELWPVCQSRPPAHLTPSRPTPAPRRPTPPRPRRPFQKDVG